MTRLVLASTSKYRRELLSRLEVEFDCAAPTFDEDAHRDAFDSQTDEAFATQMAIGKARSLAGDRFVLAADQVGVIDGPPRHLLTKPGTVDAAVEQLMLLAGKTHALTTAVVLVEPGTGRVHTAIDRQLMTMRAFGREEAARYVQRYQPLDCVGSYRIEDAGIGLFEAIDGRDFTGIIGLPLLAVARLLRDVGLL